MDQFSSFKHNMDRGIDQPEQRSPADELARVVSVLKGKSETKEMAELISLLMDVERQPALLGTLYRALNRKGYGFTIFQALEEGDELFNVLYDLRQLLKAGSDEEKKQAAEDVVESFLG